MDDEIVESAGAVALVRRKHDHFGLFQKWYANEGEWHQYDAPWEEIPQTDTATAKANYLKSLERERLGNYRQLIIKNDEDYVGWISIYEDGAHVSAKMMGIDICEDSKLNQGIGTAAIKLGIAYIFRAYQCPRIGLVTWSFNPRMIHVAQKTGFREVARVRRARTWNGEWIDCCTFMLTKQDWEKLAVGSH